MSWNIAIDKVSGRKVEFFAKGADFYTKDSFFCTYLDFDGKVGLEVAEVSVDDLEVVNELDDKEKIIKGKIQVINLGR